MNQTKPDYEKLIERFITWAEAAPEIRGAIMIGSRTRADQPADEWADLDILVITTRPDLLLSQNEWLHRIGDPRIFFRENAAFGSDQERRVLFAGGLDVDFAIIPKKSIAQLIFLFQLSGKPFPAWLIPRKMQQVSQSYRPQVVSMFKRGFRILVDKDGLAQKAVQISITQEMPLPKPPAEPEFLNTIHSFWYDAVWTAKHLRRGELWWAKSCLDFKMKWHGFLQMAEWHARAIHGPGYDTWHRGRFLEQWADPRAIAGLKEAFAHYDPEDAWRGLEATTNLFQWMARETAGRLGYEYPASVEDEAVELLKKLAPKEWPG
jgi:aminoglycoside 6-adenylyltransferase